MSEETRRRLAVALQYDRLADQAPRVVAKGRGLVADQIVALAAEHDIVIEANPILAEALSGVELDEAIPVGLYEAVAAVLGFVLRQNAQGGRTAPDAAGEKSAMS